MVVLAKQKVYKDNKRHTFEAYKSFTIHIYIGNPGMPTEIPRDVSKIRSGNHILTVQDNPGNLQNKDIQSEYTSRSHSLNPNEKDTQFFGVM